MTARPRPEDCCDEPLPCAPLPAKGRLAIVRLFKALGDPTRLEIFRLVAAQESPICVCDIVARFHLSQPTISHHLAVLCAAGLVTSERRGVWSYLSVRPEGVEALRAAALSLSPSEEGARP